jgi:hypothetical protein
VNAERRTTRRRFLIVGGLSASALAGAGVIRLTARDPKQLTSRVGAALAGDAIRDAGREYLGAHPGENDETKLIGLLRSRPEWRRIGSEADVPSALRRSRRADFDAGRIVNVGGWYLAESEARACALTTFA